jgi:hypothetical protein
MTGKQRLVGRVGRKSNNWNTHNAYFEWLRCLGCGALAGSGLPVERTLSIDARGEAAMALHEQRLLDLLNLSACDDFEPVSA